MKGGHNNCWLQSIWDLRLVSLLFCVRDFLSLLVHILMYNVWHENQILDGSWIMIELRCLLGPGLRSYSNTRHAMCWKVLNNQWSKQSLTFIEERHKPCVIRVLLRGLIEMMINSCLDRHTEQRRWNVVWSTTCIRRERHELGGQSTVIITRSTIRSARAAAAQALLLQIILYLVLGLGLLCFAT